MVRICFSEALVLGIHLIFDCSIDTDAEFWCQWCNSTHVSVPSVKAVVKTDV